MECSPCISSTTPRTSTSAQRLTASMECSRHRGGDAEGLVAVLNALRRQWNVHRCSACGRSGAARCAQRLTASMECSPSGPGEGSHPGVVLNALRRQWNVHRRPGAPGCRGSRAQRLTASMECSLNGGRGISGLIRCSTPYGVNGMFTLEIPVEGLDHAQVLNALRRQWNVHRITMELSSENVRCSTPYGVNGMFTPFLRPCTPDFHRVLNALRRQWNVHLVPRVVRAAGARVLNALRRQWNVHSCRPRRVP